MRHALVQAGMLIALLSACDVPVIVGGAAGNMPGMWFDEDADSSGQTTDIGPNPKMRVLVNDVSPFFLARLVSDTKADLKLTGFDGVDRPFTPLPDRDASAPPEFGGGVTTEISLRANVPLEAGWYELSIASSIAESAHGAVLGFQFKGGRVGTLFRVGSEAVVGELTFCREIRDRDKVPPNRVLFVFLTFTEPVKLKPGAAVSDAVKVVDLATGLAITCTPTDDSVAPGALSSTWNFECGALRSAVRVEINDALVSRTGESVHKFRTAVPGLSVETDLTALFDQTGDGTSAEIQRCAHADVGWPALVQ